MVKLNISLHLKKMGCWLLVFWSPAWEAWVLVDQLHQTGFACDQHGYALFQQLDQHYTSSNQHKLAWTNMEFMLIYLFIFFSQDGTTKTNY